MLATTAVAKTLTPRLCSRWAPNQITGSCGKSGVILRQDLFDRLDPNNLQSDWPGPSAQPGQFRSSALGAFGGDFGSIRMNSDYRGVRI
jgi:hypothetical protein